MRRATALLGAVLVIGGLAWPTTATTSEFIAADVVSLAANVSAAMVPDGAAEAAVLITADDELAYGAPSLLAALPLNVPLLVTEAGTLSDGVLDELHRATGRDESATVHLVGDAAFAQAELEAAGYTVIAHEGADATAVASAAATQLYGAPAGTSQRVILVPSGDEVTAALASALGIWLSIPVIPVGSAGFTSEAFVREVWAVGDFGGAVPPVSTAGPATLRTFDADDVFALALALDEQGGLEPGDSAPPTVVSHAPIVASVSGDTTPALVAATVAARRSLDGDRAPLLLVEDTFDHDFATRCDGDGADAASYCALAAADGDVTFVGLSDSAPDGQSDDDLPATGGGIALVGAALVAGALLRRRS
ncbi:MAG: hypothetical protein R3249_11930 [Nitriliruptorales bacterium]|nr:hypothetical protein [Nitriliruptorales bacterium]